MERPVTRLAFVDIETTGLDPDRHEPWEVALILRDDERADEEHVWQLDVDLTAAEPGALRTSRYYERWDSSAFHAWTPGVEHPVSEIARLTAGAYLVGANPAFDATFLDRLIRRRCGVPAWHYRLIDVEALAMGFAHGLEHGLEEGIATPTVVDPDADLATASPRGLSTVAEALGVHVDQAAKHTALGDARVARDIYDVITHRQFGAPDPIEAHSWTYPERTSTGVAHG